jgi:hypothetical protein
VGFVHGQFLHGSISPWTCPEANGLPFETLTRGEAVAASAFFAGTAAGFGGALFTAGFCFRGGFGEFRLDGVGFAPLAW